LPQLRALRPHDEILLTDKPLHAEALAFEAAQHGRNIAAAGGDGTLGEVLNGIMRAQSDVTLAVIPFGTGNDFARTLKIASWQQALQTLDEGETRRIDTGLTRYENRERFWLNIAGAGIDAVVAARINKGGWLRGTPAYIAALTHTLRTFRAGSIELTHDGTTEQYRALLCAICNAQSYGGGMRIAPDAALDDGLFDTCVIRDATTTEFLRAFPSVFRGAHTTHPKIVMNRAAKISLRCDGWPVLLDGEVWIETAQSTVDFNLLPQAVKFLFPNASD
jgi:diacylglycerol kinase (ATP)